MYSFNCNLFVITSQLIRVTLLNSNIFIKPYFLFKFNNFSGRIVPPVTFEDIDPVFRKALSEIDRGMALLDSKLSIDREHTLTTLQRVLVISLHLAALMAKLLEEPDCTEDVSRKIHKAVYSLVKLDIKVRHMNLSF